MSQFHVSGGGKPGGRGPEFDFQVIRPGEEEASQGVEFASVHATPVGERGDGGERGEQGTGETGAGTEWAGGGGAGRHADGGEEGGEEKILHFDVSSSTWN